MQRFVFSKDIHILGDKLASIAAVGGDLVREEGVNGKVVLRTENVRTHRTLEDERVHERLKSLLLR